MSGDVSSESAHQTLSALVERGELTAAENLARQLLQSAPGDSRWPSWLGFTLLVQGRLPESEAAYLQALALNPKQAADWDRLGVVVRRQGRPAEAEAHACRAIILDGAVATYRINLAQALFDQQRWQEACTHCRQGLSLNSNDASSWHLLGLSCIELGDLSGAETALRQSVELDPARRAFQHGLANVLLWLSAYPEAESSLRAHLNNDPQSAEAWSQLGVALQAQGDAVGAVAAFRQSAELAPDYINHSRLLHGLQYLDHSRGELLLAHQKWAAAHANRPLSPDPCLLTPGLRIGLVAQDIGIKPLGFLALGALEALDSAHCSLVCYSDRPLRPEFAARFQAVAQVRENLERLSDDQLAQQIREDQIDILVDLSGHTGKRLRVFATRPAPLQVTWLGYVGTTGLSAIDFLLADRFHVPPGEDSNYAESILRMPNDYACYAPPPEAPPVAPLPALASGQITFGCFNYPAKFSQAILEAWAEILRRVPSAHLLLKYRGLHHPKVQSNLRSRFTSRGISGDRILFEGRSLHADLLAAYNRIDLALDTQPYSGGLTTCEALWMGVPVITSPGQTFAGRHSVSHLTNAGYPEFIAADLPAYIDLAVHWANRPHELALIRSQMRDRLRLSPLCDARAFAKDFLNALTQAFHSKFPAEP